MGNQQLGGGVETIGSNGNDLTSPFSYGNGEVRFRREGSLAKSRNFGLDPEILASETKVPITVVTPPEEECLTTNGFKDCPITTAYKAKRRGSIALGALGERRGSRADVAHLPNLNTGTVNPSRDRINSLLGAPKPSRVRRGSIDTNPMTLLPNQNLSPERSSSPSVKRFGSRSKLFDKLLAINKSSDKLDIVEKNEDADESSPPKSPFNKPRRGRRASDGSALAALGVAALKISQFGSKNTLEPLNEGSGRYFYCE